MKKIYLPLLAVILCAQAAPSFAGEPAEVYKAKCATCHGKDQKGNPAMAKMFKVEPAAMDLTALTKSDEDLAKVITDGRGKMPAFKDKLSAEEITGVVSYLKGSKTAEAAPAPAAAPAENALYKANCITCHGKDGKGNPAMAKMFKVEPAAMDLTATTKSDEDLARIISEGQGKMPAFKAKLKPGQVTEIVGFIKPAAKEVTSAPAAGEKKEPVTDQKTAPEAAPAVK